ncbi:MAG: SpoIVB peptidase [Ruminococcus sp.]|nr:SpoIVB peptidase [Ruminococcus sp.]
MQIRRLFTRTAAAVLSAALIGMFGAAEYYSRRVPSDLTAEAGAGLSLAGFPELSFSEAVPASGQATLALFGAIPVKNVEIHRAQAPVLTAGGEPFGIKLLMEGVMVTGLGDVEPPGGSGSCPAAEAGVEVGDVIKRAGGLPVSSNAELQRIISSSGGREVSLEIDRGGAQLTASLRPVMSGEGWRGGMWVRDSIAGIGTVTFIDRSTGAFAGLGHPICDSDTGGLVPLQSGEAVPVEITEAQKGERGLPGELRGKFGSSGPMGVLTENCHSGIYGTLTKASSEGLTGEEYKLAYRQEVTKGEAFIRTTVSGTEPRLYSAQIESVDYSDSASPKNMVIRITDRELLEATGGIVQGMSGSPIIQNGKLVGAVTHVFVADPTRGYGIFAETMAAPLMGE